MGRKRYRYPRGAHRARIYAGRSPERVAVAAPRCAGGSRIAPAPGTAVFLPSLIGCLGALGPLALARRSLLGLRSLKRGWHLSAATPPRAFDARANCIEQL